MSGNSPWRRMKHGAKRALQSTLPTRLPPLIVASMGRSGSTLVHDALCEAMTVARFPSALYGLGSRIVRDQAWDLDNRSFTPGIVYKTHALAHEMPDRSPAKVIFLFGPATDAALSVRACRDRYGADWIEQHFEHLRATGPFEDLGKRDVLRFGEQVDGWIGKTGTPRIILHYDALWEHEEALSEFTGLRVELPPRKARKGADTADAATREVYAKTYAALDARIAGLPRCQVLE